MTGRIVQHSTKTETLEVGDVPGHVLGVAQQTGLIFYSTGEIATTMNTVCFDFVKGKGTFTNYRVTTFQDGSTTFSKGGGTAIPVDGGKRTVWEGPIECIGGTGKFEHRFHHFHLRKFQARQHLGDVPTNLLLLTVRCHV